MKLRFLLSSPARPKHSNFNLAFGSACLRVDRVGRCRITGGSESDRLDILEWISLCAPELVPENSGDKRADRKALR